MLKEDGLTAMHVHNSYHSFNITQSPSFIRNCAYYSTLQYTNALCLALLCNVL